MQQDNARNTILFIVFTVAILVLYQIFVLQPQTERQRAERAAAEASQPAGDAARTVGRPEAVVFASRRDALAAGPRVPIRSEALTGSISLRGARIDDLFLSNYRETLDADSPPVELFRPQGAEHAFFAYVGWNGQNIPGLPGPDTLWRLTSGTELAPGRPVTLSYDNGQGLTFTRVIAIDEQYLFTVTDTVANRGGQAVTLAPYGSVQRWGVPETLGRQFILHEGAIGVFGSGDRFNLQLSKYKDWAKEPRETFASTGGWLGITDKYWLAALLPEQDEPMSAEFRVRQLDGMAVHEANFLGQAWTIAPGRQATETVRLFAGAKRSEILAAYGEELGAPRLNDAIDWGMFWFLTKPLFGLIEWFYGLVGNFGVAILLLTVVVKLALFPLANKAYESMSKMKNLQPKMEEIKKKHAGDAPKQQQEMMVLYQREKINPLAGCLPLLIQIPIFYALYKTLFVTIEMRHSPFVLWIKDLSSRDPTTIWNLFGLLPWDPAMIGGFVGGILNGPLHLGVLPLLYGLTMWLQMAMNPPAADPTQRQIFALLPFVFTFIMAPFAAGLILYWAWSNVLTIIQQYFIMHRFKADNPIDRFIDRMRKPKDA